MTTHSIGKHTETVGTHIVAVCPARDTGIPVLTSVSVTTGAASQTLYVCAPMGLTENRAMLPAGATSVEVMDIAPLKYSDGTSKKINSDSIIVVISQHGSYEALKVSSVSGNTVTFSSGPSADVLVRSIMYVMYDPTEESIGPPPAPTTLHPSFEIDANTTVNYDNLFLQGGVRTGGGAFALGQGVPMVLFLTNTSAQAQINSATFEYIDKSEELIFAIYGADVAAADGLPRPQPIDLPTLP